MFSLSRLSNVDLRNSRRCIKEPIKLKAYIFVMQASKIVQNLLRDVNDTCQMIETPIPGSIAISLKSHNEQRADQGLWRLQEASWKLIQWYVLAVLDLANLCKNCKK